MRRCYRFHPAGLQVSEEEGFAQPSDEQLSFTLRLFDLNQDGQLTTNEMLTALALDAVVRACWAFNSWLTGPHGDD